MRISRYALSISAAAMLAGCGGSQPPISGPDSMPRPSAEFGRSGAKLPYHQTFKYTGTEQSFVVPTGAKSLHIVALGA
ncbi:MAG: hypothetical protein WBE77_11500, partial [Candidatus Cybelea sp.]